MTMIESRSHFGVWFGAVVTAALAIALLYQVGAVPPMWTACLAFTTAFVVAIGVLKLPNHSLLCRYVLVIYSAPFVHCIDYVFNDIGHFQQQASLWGMIPNEYQRSLDVMERVGTAGAIGALALVSGMLLAGWLSRRRVDRPESRRRLAWSGVFLLASAAVGLAWLNAPRQTIFEAQYTQAQSVLEGTNFNAAFLVSFVFAGLLSIDAIVEHARRTRRLKMLVVAAVLTVIVVWLQFLRGDRECFGLIVAVAVLTAVVRPRAISRVVPRKRALVVAAIALLLVAVVAQRIGTARRDVVGESVLQIFASQNVTAMHGPWSGILMTPISVIGDFYYDRMSFKNGQTYLDYVLSLPPGVVADAVGYRRPIEGTRGPAWEMRYGQGGTHLMVVPFMNFGILGVVFVLAAVGWLVASVELRTTPTNIRSLLRYATFFIIAPLWIWYGDMLLIRGLMCYYGAWWVYRFLPKRGRRSPVAVVISQTPFIAPPRELGSQQC